MAQTLKSSKFPKTIYVARDDNGQIHFYDRDPKDIADRSRGFDLAGAIADFVGGDVTALNPAAMNIVVASLTRARAFDVTYPQKIANGLDAHLEDELGNVIVIYPQRGADARYPFCASVIDAQGRVSASRNYSFRGECSDGRREHSLVVVDGRFEQGNDFEAMEAEAAQQQREEAEAAQDIEDAQSGPQMSEEVNAVLDPDGGTGDVASPLACGRTVFQHINLIRVL